MSMEMGELAVTADGKQVYSYKASGKGRKPTDAELLRLLGL